MKDRIFIDTNILIYLTIDKEKSIAIKERLKNYNDIYISAQVLNEFSNTCFKKQLLSSDEIKNAIEIFIRMFKVVSLNQQNTLKAIELKNRYSFSFYDCLIIASSIENSCKFLITEDTHHNQVIESSLKIINPFI